MQHVQVSELKDGANFEQSSLPLAKAHGIVVRRKQESHLGPISQADQDNANFVKGEPFDVRYSRLQDTRLVPLGESHADSGQSLSILYYQAAEHGNSFAKRDGIP